MVTASPPVGAQLGVPGLSGLRVAYSLSVGALVLLALATLASPLLLPALRRGAAPLPDAGKLQIVAKDAEWVLQYNLTNHTEQDGTYTFEIAAAESSGAARGSAANRSVHTTTVLVGAGRTYVFIYHLRPGEMPDGPVQFTVQRGGDPAPAEDVTLHLPAPGSSR